MIYAQTLTSEVRYMLQLIQAGMSGATSAWKTTGITPVLSAPVWTPTAIGAAVGAAAASLRVKRRHGNRAAMGGLVGGVLGMSCGMAWASRGLTAALAEGAIRKIGDARDLHWLENNPIDYA